MKVVKQSQFAHLVAQPVNAAAFFEPRIVSGLHRVLSKVGFGVPVRLEIDFSAGPKSATMVAFFKRGPDDEPDPNPWFVTTTTGGNAALEFDPGNPNHDFTNHG